MTAMTGPWWLVGVLALAGAGLGRWLAQELANCGYRIDDETDRPLPSRSWTVALGVPLVWGLLAWKLGGPATLDALPALLLVGLAGVALARIDLDVHRLPHGLTVPTAWGAGGIILAAAVGAGDWAALLRAVGSGAAAYLVLFVLALLARGQFGLGDVTLGGILGLVLGQLDLRTPWWGLLLAFVLSGLVSLVGLAPRRLTLTSHLAFGPFLLLGALLAVLLR